MPQKNFSKTCHYYYVIPLHITPYVTPPPPPVKVSPLSLSIWIDFYSSSSPFCNGNVGMMMAAYLTLSLSPIIYILYDTESYISTEERRVKRLLNVCSLPIVFVFSQVLRPNNIASPLPNLNHSLNERERFVPCKKRSSLSFEEESSWLVTTLIPHTSSSSSMCHPIKEESHYKTKHSSGQIVSPAQSNEETPLNTSSTWKSL